jgi:hypothetical protein
MTIQTRWITAYYNPQQEPPEVHPETDHHLVYAAMLDGVIGGKRIADYTCVPPTTVNRLVRDLADQGYCKKVLVQGQPTYVPLGAFSECDV